MAEKTTIEVLMSVGYDPVYAEKTAKLVDEFTDKVLRKSMTKEEKIAAEAALKNVRVRENEAAAVGKIIEGTTELLSKAYGKRAAMREKDTSAEIKKAQEVADAKFSIEKKLAEKEAALAGSIPNQVDLNKELSGLVQPLSESQRREISASGLTPIPTQADISKLPALSNDPTDKITSLKLEINDLAKYQKVLQDFDQTTDAETKIIKTAILKTIAARKVAAQEEIDILSKKLAKEEQLRAESEDRMKNEQAGIAGGTADYAGNPNALPRSPDIAFQKPASEMTSSEIVAEMQKVVDVQDKAATATELTKEELKLEKKEVAELEKEMKGLAKFYGISEDEISKLTDEQYNYVKSLKAQTEEQHKQAKQNHANTILAKRQLDIWRDGMMRFTQAAAVVAATGTAATYGLFRSAGSYAGGMGKQDSVGKDFTSAYKELELAQQRFGRTAAQAMTPLIKQATYLVNKVVDFIEKHPELVTAAANIAIALAVAGTIAAAIGKGATMMMSVAYLMMRSAEINAAAAVKGAKGVGLRGVMSAMGMGGTARAAASFGAPATTGAIGNLMGGAPAATGAAAGGLAAGLGAAAVLVVSAGAGAVIGKALANALQRAAGAKESSWKDIGDTFKYLAMLPTKVILLGVSKLSPAFENLATKINDLQNNLFGMGKAADAAAKSAANLADLVEHAEKAYAIGERAKTMKEDIIGQRAGLTAQTGIQGKEYTNARAVAESMLDNILTAEEKLRVARTFNALETAKVAESERQSMLAATDAVKEAEKEYAGALEAMNPQKLAGVVVTEEQKRQAAIALTAVELAKATEAEAKRNAAMNSVISLGGQIDDVKMKMYQLGNALTDLDKSFADSVNKLQSDFARQEQEAQRNLAEEMRNIQEDNNKAELEAEKEHQKRLAALLKEHNKRVAEFIAARDALGLAKENADYKDRVKEENDQYAEEKRKLHEALNTRIKELNESYKKEAMLRRRALEDQMAALKLEYEAKRKVIIAEMEMAQLMYTELMKLFMEAQRLILEMRAAATPPPVAGGPSPVGVPVPGAKTPAEKLLGGKVSASALMNMLAGGANSKSLVVNDTRRFNAEIPASERRKIANETMKMLTEVFNGI